MQYVVPVSDGYSQGPPVADVVARRPLSHGCLLSSTVGGVSAAVSKTAAAPIERIKLLIQNQVSSHTLLVTVTRIRTFLWQPDPKGSRSEISQ